MSNATPPPTDGMLMVLNINVCMIPVDTRAVIEPSRSYTIKEKRRPLVMPSPG